MWDIPTKRNVIYLTFDDGPHPIATPYVLRLLKKYDAKATFFCIGKNVTEYPLIYKEILDAGHLVGNHTNFHLNGWKSGTVEYINDIFAASKNISSNFFRPPYGRITKKQGNSLIEKGFNIIMWDVLSADFDTTITPEKCYQNVKRKARRGSIIVFHDSEKAFNNLAYALPKTLEYFTDLGFSFESLKK